MSSIAPLKRKPLLEDCKDFSIENLDFELPIKLTNTFCSTIKYKYPENAYFLFKTSPLTFTKDSIKLLDNDINLIIEDSQQSFVSMLKTIDDFAISHKTNLINKILHPKSEINIEKYEYKPIIKKHLGKSIIVLKNPYFTNDCLIRFFVDGNPQDIKTQTEFQKLVTVCTTMQFLLQLSFLKIVDIKNEESMSFGLYLRQLALFT